MVKKIIFSLFLMATLSLYAQENPKMNKKDFYSLSEERSNINYAIRKGNSYYKDGMYDAALQQYMKLYNIKDDYSPLNYKIAVSHLFGVNPKNALEFFNQTNDNVASDYYCLKGIAYIYHQQYDDAVKAFLQYKESLPPKQVSKEMDKINRLYEICDFSATACQDSLPVFIINAGANVNSNYDDYSAVELLTPSPALYFTSRRPKNNNVSATTYSVFSERILYSEKNTNGEVDEAKNVKLKSGKHLSVAGVDNNTGTLLYYKGKKRFGDVYSVQFYGKDGKIINDRRLKPVISKKTSMEGVISFADNGDAYFISDRLGGMGGKDIWYAMKKDKNNFYPPQNMRTLNTPFNEEHVFVTPDGNTLYFSSNGLPGFGGYDIYKSVRTPDGTWGDPVNMGYPVNSPDDDLYYRLTSDTTLALLSSKRSGGFGGLDIYFVKKDVRIPFELSGNVTDVKTGKTLAATVKMVNRTTSQTVASTANDTIQQRYLLKIEDTGNYYLHAEADGYHPVTDSFVNPVVRHSKLYHDFALEKLLHPYTLNGYITDMRTGRPVMAEILIKPSGRSNVLYRTVSNESNGYYSLRIEDKDNFDLTARANTYFDHNESLLLKSVAEDVGDKNISMQKSINTFIASGVVISESNGTPLKATISANKISGGQTVQTAVTDDNGKYDLILSDIGPFLMEANSEGHFYANRVLQFHKDSTLVIRNFTLKKMESGVKIVIENILFNTGNATLRPESFASLNKLVSLLQENPNVKIEVSGHTDNTGSATTNKTLSKNRASSVRNYLISNGISGERVKFEGYGFDRPIAPNTTANGRAANRRVEIEILD